MTPVGSGADGGGGVKPEWISSMVAGLALIVAAWSSTVTLLLSKRMLRITSYSDTTTHVNQLNLLLVQYPNLRPYFYDNEAPPTKGEPDYNRVLAAADLHLDVAEKIWRHHDEYVAADVIGWREWIHDLFEYSPVIRDIVFRGRYLYPALVELLEKEPCTQSEHVLALRFLHGVSVTAPDQQPEAMVALGAPARSEQAERPEETAGQPEPPMSSPPESLTL